jgi:hypothetical protein
MRILLCFILGQAEQPKENKGNAEKAALVHNCLVA